MCSPMVQETWVQSQAASYQRLLKWYLMPPCLTLSNIRYVSRVKWCNPGKGVAPSPTPRCSSYWKGSLLITLEYGQMYELLITKQILPPQLLRVTDAFRIVQFGNIQVERDTPIILYDNAMESRLMLKKMASAGPWSGSGLSCLLLISR